MKHACLLVILTLLFVPYRSSGFVESRHQWWEIRLKKIQEEKARLSSREDTYPPILQLLDREAARAREIIAVLEDDMRDDGSLTHEERVFTRDEVAAEAQRVVPPLYALSVMELLVIEPSRAANRAVARDAVRRRLERAIGSALGREDPGLAGQIMASDLLPTDWERISSEITLGRLMAGWQPGEEAACREVSRRLCEELERKDFVTNGKELRRRALLAAMEHLRDGAVLESFGGADESLASSWSWRTAHASIDRGLAAYVRWIGLMGTEFTLPADTAARVYNSPIEMDTHLFRTRHGEFDIEDRNLPALAEIDRIRAAVVLSMTGREEPSLIDDTASRFDAAIERHTAATRDLLLHEEKALHDSGTGPGKNAVSAADTRAARTIFERRLSLLRAYRDRSLAFIRLVRESKMTEGGEVLSGYRYRTARCREYVAFALDLVKGCAGLAAFGDQSLHGRYRAAMGSLGSLFRFTGSSHNLDGRLLPHVARGDITKLRAIKMESIAAINSMRSEMRDFHARYGRDLSRTEDGRTQARERLEEKIAQAEIDALVAHASECAALLGELDHAGEALARYALRFQSCNRDAKNGDISPDLAHAARRGSLIPLVDGFDSPRITREYAARRYLVSETRTTLARLVALTRFYEKNGTTPRDLPDAGDIGEIERRAGMKVSVRVDAWEMNEANIAEVDRKAAAKISALIRRRSYAPRGGANAPSPLPPGHATKVRLDEPKITLSFPAGWEERQVGEIDSLRGIVRMFSNTDHGSLVRLVAVPLQKGGHERAAEEWIRKTGATPVEKKKVRVGDIEYLRILARDRDRNISETCCVERDGYALLINGTTLRHQYMKFNIHFERIIESLGVDGM